MSRIGINLLYINPKFSGGSVTYAKKLIQSLQQQEDENEYIVYINKDCNSDDFSNRKFTVRVIPFSYSNVYYRYFWEQFIFPFFLLKDSLDILHSLGYVCPIFAPCKQIVSILDINFKGHGAQMKPLKRFLLSIMVSLSSKISKKIITISRFSKAEICSYLNVSEQKVIVTHLSGSTDEIVNKSSNKSDVLQKYNIQKPYLVAFNSTSPHKNIERLISAFDLIAKSNSELKLLLIGHNYTSPHINKMLENELLKSKIVFTGFVPDADIPDLIKNSSVFVFPSLYEGFGIPLLDAQSLGVPIASSHAGSLPEVGGSGVLYFNPSVYTEICNAIKKFDDLDFRNQCVQINYSNRNLFSWEKTAAETRLVYNQLLKKDGE